MKNNISTWKVRAKTSKWTWPMCIVQIKSKLWDIGKVIKKSNIINRKGVKNTVTNQNKIKFIQKKETTKRLKLLDLRWAKAQEAWNQDLQQLQRTNKREPSRILRWLWHNQSNGQSWHWNFAQVASQLCQVFAGQLGLLKRHCPDKKLCKWTRFEQERKLLLDYKPFFIWFSVLGYCDL